MEDTNEWQFLHLNDDETLHYKQLSREVGQHLALAENAAIITVNGLMSLEDHPHINEPAGLVSLLMVKTAKNIRLGVIGLKLGYYPGASAVLRSALESLLYASLFHSDPSQIAIWLRNEFSGRPKSELDEPRSKQMQYAKKDLLGYENEPRVIKDAMMNFWRDANKYSHATLEGLAKEFGVDIEYLVPDELAEAEGDLDQALDRYALLSSFGKNMLREYTTTGEIDKEKLTLEIVGRYDEDTIFELSSFAFYIAHRLLDITNTFAIKDKEFNKNYRDWHKAIKQLGEAYNQ